MSDVHNTRSQCFCWFPYLIFMSLNARLFKGGIRNLFMCYWKTWLIISGPCKLDILLKTMYELMKTSSSLLKNEYTKVKLVIMPQILKHLEPLLLNGVFSCYQVGERKKSIAWYIIWIRNSVIHSTLQRELPVVIHHINNINPEVIKTQEELSQERI